MKRTSDISIAARALKDGKLVAFATETVYGLGADGRNELAVANIFAAKGRPQFNPLIVHVDDISQAQKLGKLNADALRLADALWPGPLTLVLPRTENCSISKLTSAGLNSIAIRVPAHPQARDLLQHFGGPVVAPSANRSGMISPTCPEHVISGLKEKIDVLLDGGNCEIGLESTIISCLGRVPEILRHGAVTKTDIEKLIGPVEDVQKTNDKKPVAPGQLTSHYAPNANMRMNVIDPYEDEALLGFGATKYDAVLNLSPDSDLTQAAANLFAMLHQLDQMGVAKIAVSPIPEIGLGAAINDRLNRASAPRPHQASAIGASK